MTCVTGGGQQPAPFVRRWGGLFLFSEQVDETCMPNINNITEWQAVENRPTKQMRQALYKFGVARTTVAVLNYEQADQMLKALIAADVRKKQMAAVAADAEGWEVVK